MFLLGLAVTVKQTENIRMNRIRKRAVLDEFTNILK
jgi:hypothetical protein